jgi:hypothetical protein
VKNISVALKLSTTEERSQDQTCLFRRGYYRNRDHSPAKSVLGSKPAEIVCVARKISTTEERRQDQNCLFFEERLTELEATTPKTRPGFETQ